MVSFLFAYRVFDEPANQFADALANGTATAMEGITIILGLPRMALRYCLGRFFVPMGQEDSLPKAKEGEKFSQGLT
jgi:hypothetical protein